MADLHLLEDTATLYVLGRLTDGERGEFEAQLAQSAGLRALVHELEQGMVAVAMASPRRRAPQQVWERIEKVVAEKTRPPGIAFPFWFAWLRNGWTVVAACLVGWLLYALWADRAAAPDVAPFPIASKANLPTGGPTTDPARTAAEGLASPPRNTTNPEHSSPPGIPSAVTREMGALRAQNMELAKQVAHLSQVLAQQQALLAEPSRLKFFQLGLTSDASTGATNAAPSPALQRALFLAMAREFGWLQLPASTQSGSTLTNQGGVDFVDFHPGETTLPINTQPQIGSPSPSTPDSPSLASNSGHAIPGFMGTNIVLAFDSSVVPTGSDLTFWTGNYTQGYQPIGSAVLGNNPMVVTIPSAGTTPAGMSLTVTAGTSAGFSNVIGQFPPTGPTPP